MSLVSGSRLGPYELLEPLGAGGMGEVWKARDTRLGRVVAIKQVAPKHRERFEHEARAIAALNHPHICQIYDVGPDYLVLEYIEGERVRGPLPVAEALRLAVQIAGALEEAHRHGILHRDLKPSNILISRSSGPGSGRSLDPPTAKLLDFGLARLASGDADATRTVEGTVVGTAAYMSPEQANGRPVDQRSDIFSFGAVLYEMLAGTRAFDGDTSARAVSAVLRDDPRPLDAPPRLQNIVTRCLRKQQADRFQTMGEVRAALEEATNEQSSRTEPRPSIAILPFADMSPGKDHEWFSDGIAEEIINVLAQIPDLKVIARTSAFAFKGKQEDVRRIAETLGVSTILEGSVRRAGNQVRVTAQLIAAVDGSHLWSNRYDRELADVFAIQDEIAQAIAAALQPKLASRGDDSKRYTPLLQAYEAFLKAEHVSARFTPTSVTQAREYLEQAIALDPKFAAPHAGLGMFLFMLAMLGTSPAHDVMPRARAAANKAVAIDPSDPDGHVVLGLVALFYDYDLKEGERRFSLALAHGPLPIRCRILYGAYLRATGRLPEVEAQLLQVVEEDPLNAIARWSLANCLNEAGRYAEAEVQARKALEFEPDNWFAYVCLATSHLQSGDVTGAVAHAEEAQSRAPWSPIATGVLAGLLRRTGQAARADTLIQKLGPSDGYGVPYSHAMCHLISGELDQAVGWWEKAIEQRYPYALLPVGNVPGALHTVLRSTSAWPRLAKLMNIGGIVQSGEVEKWKVEK